MPVSVALYSALLLISLAVLVLRLVSRKPERPKMRLDTPVDPALPMALISQMLSGRYELRELLGEGTLFATFRGFDNKQKRDVIVKTLLPQHTGNAELLASLRSGVGDVLAFAHVGIARPFDVGADEEKGVACSSLRSTFSASIWENGSPRTASYLIPSPSMFS
jgi:serine/threonine protein kinase